MMSMEERRSCLIRGLVGDHYDEWLNVPEYKAEIERLASQMLAYADRVVLPDLRSAAAWREHVTREQVEAWGYAKPPEPEEAPPNPPPLSVGRWEKG